MSGQIRKWDIYALEQLHCPDHTIDVFLHTHDKDGNFYPTVGQWFDHCFLMDIHPFFAGNPMPVTEEGLNNLLLVENDVLRQTVRRFGKSWWREEVDKVDEYGNKIKDKDGNVVKERRLKEEDYRLYKEFSSKLQKHIGMIPYEQRKKYECQKHGFKTMETVVVYDPETPEFILNMRVNWYRARLGFPDKLFSSSKFLNDFSQHKVRRFFVSFGRGDSYKREEDFLKKSGRPFQSGPAAFVAEIGSRLDDWLFDSYSWGKDRLPGFGVEVWRLTHRMDGMPLPNVSEWFAFCRKNDVHPFVPGYGCRFSEAGFILDFSRWERQELAVAEKVWKGRNPDMVIMECASQYDLKYPLPDGSKRAYGVLQVEDLLKREHVEVFPDVSVILQKKMDSLILFHERRRKGLSRFADQVIRSARHRSEQIISNDSERLSMEWNIRPAFRRAGKENMEL